MEDIPSIIIVSCSNTKPKSLIKLLTKSNGTEEGGLVKKRWTIDTKYYTAEVDIIGIEKHHLEKGHGQNAEALIIHMDCNKDNGIKDLRQWENFASFPNIEIKILISNYCNDDTKITRSQAMEWCLKRGFEFVELYPQEDKNASQDDDHEKSGADRIVEALQAHTWSNLKMKSKSSDSKFGKKTKKNKKTDQSSVLKGLTDEDFYLNDGMDEFTELFSQLHMMKDGAQNMPIIQRRQCAEQLVTKFWKAIGGEEEEIFDL